MTERTRLIGSTSGAGSPHRRGQAFRDSLRQGSPPHDLLTPTAQTSPSQRAYPVVQCEPPHCPHLEPRPMLTLTPTLALIPVPTPTPNPNPVTPGGASGLLPARGPLGARVLRGGGRPLWLRLGPGHRAQLGEGHALQLLHAGCAVVGRLTARVRTSRAADGQPRPRFMQVEALSCYGRVGRSNPFSTRPKSSPPTAQPLTPNPYPRNP